MSVFGKRKDESSQVGPPRGVRVQEPPREPPPPVPSPSPAPVVAPAPAAHRPRFGIAEAIALLQSIPADSGGTAAFVIRRTLEAVGISIPDVLADGARKAAHLETEMEQLSTEADALERRALDTRARIAQLEHELSTVNHARARFDDASMHDVGVEATVQVLHQR